MAFKILIISVTFVFPCSAIKVRYKKVKKVKVNICYSAPK